MTILIENLQSEELLEMAAECHSKTEFAAKLGFHYYNGKISKIIDNVCEKYNINISHFDPSLKLRLKAKYKKVTKECPICKELFQTKEGNRDEKYTCSWKCSNVYFSDKRHTEESRRKTSESLIKFSLPKTKKIKNEDGYFGFNKICPFCNINFFSQRNKKKYCTASCATKAKWSKDEYRSNLLNKIREKIENGTHKGWKSRAKVNRSFPERYTETILNEFGISFEPELPCGKWFIDFAFNDKKIALEIDGKQHEYADRKKSDQEKDKFLTENGWKVIRYKWKRIKTKEDRENYIGFLKEVLLSDLK